MISLDLNISLIAQMFNIPSSRLVEYGDKSIAEIMELEALNGNTQAADFEEKILNDPNKLIEFFKLESPENRYAILQNMNEEDLLKLLPYLNQESLVNALQLFSLEKIKSLFELLEPEQLVELVSKTYSTEEFLKLTKERELNKFLDSKNVEKNDFQKFLKLLPEVELKRMIENITGEPAESSYKSDIISEVQSFNDQQFFDSIKSLDFKNKWRIMNEFIEYNPELMEEFSVNALSAPMKFLQKEDAIEKLGTLKSEFLIPLIQEMPEELLPLVISQIDPNIFAQILSKDFEDILKNISL